MTRHPSLRQHPYCDACGKTHRRVFYPEIMDEEHAMCGNDPDCPCCVETLIAFLESQMK